MSTNKPYVIEHGLQVSGDVTITGTLTGDGSGLTGVSGGVSSWNDLTDKPTLFSGSYLDLTNKPTIPTSNSQLMNDVGYITSYTETDPVYTASSWYSTTNNSSNWNTAYGWGNHASAGYLTSVTWNDVSGKPTFATVATSGSYNDLANKPTIPSLTSVNSNIVPDINVVRTIGSSSRRWNAGYIQYVYTDSLNLSSTGTIALDGMIGGVGTSVLKSTGGTLSWSKVDYSEINNTPQYISSFINDAGYLTSYTDTLHSVTDRGNTTTNSITVGNINSTGNVQIDGNLTVSGTTVTINATDLVVEDNMIYLNSGSAVANPDLGIAGNYNDGTYAHAGIFRDATDGRWKFFHQYTPEPDASAFIDTSHASFALANVQANSFIGSLTGNADTVTNGVYTNESYADPAWITSLAYSKLTGTPTLAAVATSGSYNDLSDKPIMPSLTSQLTNDSGYLTSSSLSGYATEPYVTTAVSTKQDSLSVTIGGAAAWVPTTSSLTVPSRTSHLTNDSGFITSYTETSTLDNVLSRGNTSTTSITVGGLSSFNGATRTVNILNTGDATFNGSLGIGTNASGTAGEIRATNNITAYYSSDARLKENIKDVDNALDIVCAIGSKTFDWTDDYIASKGGEDGYFVQKSDFGVVAQDVQAVFPQAVRTREDGTLAVDYEKLATLSFGAIKELLKRIEALESK